MKSIGIITFHNAQNHGACLQACGTQQFLKSKGYDTYIINYDSNIKKHYNLVVPKFRKNLVKYIKHWIHNIANLKVRKVRYDNFVSFVNNYMTLSEKHYRNIISLKLAPPKYDIYITGSDQVWNTKLIGKLDDGFTLNFGNEHTKRISYAASIGLDSISAELAAKYQKKLKRMDRISVREESAKKALGQVLSKPVTVVLDPVFLLDKDYWSNCFPKREERKEEYIFVYSVTTNPELTKIAEYLSEKTGLKVLSTSRMDHYKHQIKVKQEGGPDTFVNGILGAKYVVANSFHALAFSLILQKEFYIIPHTSTNSRIDQLLAVTGLGGREVRSLKEFQKMDINRTIDYKEVGKRLEPEIERSKLFLLRGIED